MPGQDKKRPVKNGKNTNKNRRVQKSRPRPVKKNHRKNENKPLSNGPRRPQENAHKPIPNEHSKVVSMNEKRVSKRRRRGTKRARPELFVLGISLILFVISVGGSIYNFNMRGDIATMIVPYGSVDASKYIQGIIIRDEHVYTANSKGELSFHVNENERIKKGTVVCTIKDSTQAASLEAEKEQLSKKILDMQNLRLESNVSATSGDVMTINHRIKEIVDKNSYKFVGNKIEDVYGLKDQIMNNLDYRMDLLLNENWGSVQTMVEENRQYANKIDDITGKVAADTGGIVSYVVDGFESELNFENMRFISKERTAMDVVIDPPKRFREVEAGEELFKVVADNEWYIGAYIENDLIRDWEENAFKKIYIERDGQFEALEVRVQAINRGDDESYVLLKSTKKIIDYLDMRTVNFKTHDSIYSGIKVPESAIVERTFLKVPESYVYTINDNRVVLKLGADKTDKVYINTKILRNVEFDEPFVYVMQDYNNLKRGDVIVTEGENPEKFIIDDIVVSKGIFKANNGVAVFASIDIGQMTTGNNNYVILDQEANGGSSGINIYDRIVSDGNNININEGDIIY